jgi:hypothetical protein
MILVLGNFAGVFSNLCKLLNWSLLLDKSDTILFYYANKFKDNQDPTVPPFENYEADLSRIFFYKYFDYPNGCNHTSFLQKTRFELTYPKIEKEALPTCLQAYPNAYIYTNPKVYFDPNFPEIRKLYAKHLSERLQFTPYMKSFFEDELAMIQMIQAEGKTVLAVMIRSTVHYPEGCNIQSILNEIDELQVNYDFILPLTQVKPFYNTLLEKYGRKCICLSRNRVDQDQDWWFNTTDDPFEDEFRMAIADVYLASQCDCIVSGASNMLLGALFFHATVPFKIYKELETKITG